MKRSGESIKSKFQHIFIYPITVRFVCLYKNKVGKKKQKCLYMSEIYKKNFRVQKKALKRRFSEIDMKDKKGSINSKH